MRQEDWIARPAGPLLRTLHALLLATAIALLVTMGWTLLSSDEAPGRPARLAAAQACAETTVAAEPRRAALAAVLDRPVVLPPACWRTVSLPGVFQAAPGGPAHALSRARLRWQLARSADWPVSEPLMFHAPRAMGAAWQLRVDGKPVADDLEDWRMMWNRPIAVWLSPGLFPPGRPVDVELVIVHRADVDFALSTVSFGPVGGLARRVAWREFFQSTMPQACSAAQILVGVFFVGFWIMRRQETAHLMLALAGVAWSVSNLQYVLARPDDPLLEQWYDAVTGLAVCWFVWLLYLFALHFDIRRVRWLEWALPAYTVAVTLLALPVWRAADADEGFGLQVVNAVVAAALTAFIGLRALRNGRIELQVIAVAMACALAAGAHDVLLLSNVVDPEGIYLLPYGGLLVFASFLFAVQRRYVQAVDGHEQLSRSLAERVAARERELMLNHERLRELETARILADERQRLMHDMHDGLGSTLTASLAAIEHGETRPGEVAGMLRECVNDLRAVIDSLEPLHQDLVTLLASWRQRMEQRLRAAGIALEWHMDDLPPLPWLGPPEALQILRIVQEVLSNVIKHAGARHVRMSFVARRDHVEVRIADDGCGFERPGMTTGKGLRFMAQRGAGLGGRLDVESRRGGGTTVRLVLPTNREPAASSSTRPQASGPTRTGIDLYDGVPLSSSMHSKGTSTLASG